MNEFSIYALIQNITRLTLNDLSTYTGLPAFAALNIELRKFYVFLWFGVYRHVL